MEEEISLETVRKLCQIDHSQFALRHLITLQPISIISI